MASGGRSVVLVDVKRDGGDVEDDSEGLWDSEVDQWKRDVGVY